VQTDIAALEAVLWDQQRFKSTLGEFDSFPALYSSRCPQFLHVRARERARAIIHVFVLK
jgi:hypothetical protein